MEILYQTKTPRLNYLADTQESQNSSSLKTRSFRCKSSKFFDGELPDRLANDFGPSPVGSPNRSLIRNQPPRADDQIDANLSYGSNMIDSFIESEDESVCLNEDFDELETIDGPLPVLNGLRKNIKILLADDVSLSRKMIERSLSTISRECHHVGNGKDAVDYVISSIQSNDPYDVVLIDYYMPVLNGLEAIRKMREEGFKGIILAVTGSTINEDKELLLSNGADSVLLKPLDLKSFRDALNGKSSSICLFIYVK